MCCITYFHYKVPLIFVVSFLAHRVIHIFRAPILIVIKIDISTISVSIVLTGPRLAGFTYFDTIVFIVHPIIFGDIVSIMACAGTYSTVMFIVFTPGISAPKVPLLFELGEPRPLNYSVFSVFVILADASI